MVSGVLRAGGADLDRRVLLGVLGSRRSSLRGGVQWDGLAGVGNVSGGVVAGVLVVMIIPGPVPPGGGGGPAEDAGMTRSDMS